MAVWLLAVTQTITDAQAIVELEQRVQNGELVRRNDWNDQPLYARTYERPESN